MSRGFLAAAACSAATAFASSSNSHFFRVGDVTARLPACRAMILFAHAALPSGALAKAEAAEQRVRCGARETRVAGRRRPVPRALRGRAGLAWRAHDERTRCSG